MFKTTVTPRFGDIDGLQHANNIAIAIWFEQARNPIFRFFSPDLKLDYDNWKLIMASAEYDYVGQMFYGEDVEICTYVTRVGNSSFTIGQEAWQGGKMGAKGETVIVHYDFYEKKSKNIPDSIKELLKEHLIEKE